VDQVQKIELLEARPKHGPGSKDRVTRKTIKHGPGSKESTAVQQELIRRVQGDK
jgi:hypothetical protein